MTRLAYVPNRIIDHNGIADGATVHVYLSGSTTPVLLYSNAAMTTPLANPFSVAAGASFPDVFYDSSVDVKLTIVSALDGSIEEHDPYNPFYNTIPAVKDYGALGGGVTDDTTAIDTATTSVKNSGGGPLLFTAVSGGYKSHGGNRSPGMLLIDAAFPAYSYAGGEPAGPLRVYTTNPAVGGGKIAVSSVMTNGTATPFTTLGGTDSVAFSGAVFSGTDAANSVCVGNLVSRYQSIPPGINWGLEIDMNNESATSYTLGDPRGGQALVLNTGSTKSPDTALVIQRTTGEGTGPGYHAGIRINGARDYGIVFQAMAPASYPGMSPTAPGTLTILTSSVSNDVNQRWTVDETGRITWGDGTAVQDTTLARAPGGGLSCNKLIVAPAFWVGSNQVIGARDTGWTADTGTAKKTANATYTAGSTLTYSAAYVQAEQTAMATRVAALEAVIQSNSQTIKGLKDTLIAHGLIGA